MPLTTTILHLSDLHFGTVAPLVCKGLTREILRQSPQLLVISGDVTQRARKSQFRAYDEYMRQFTIPKVVVPGNHDIPLFDIFRRFLSPLKRFREYAEPNPYPEYEDENTYVLGVNSAHSWTISGGRLTEETIAEARSRFSKVPSGKARILVSHHPIQEGNATHPDWISGLERVGENIDLVLTGHLHRSHTEVLEKSRTLIARAGTAISERERGERNSFNVIRVRAREIEIEVGIWNSSAGEFEFTSRKIFPRMGMGSSTQPSCKIDFT